MSGTQSQNQPAPLTPSEILLLHAPTWASPSANSAANTPLPRGAQANAEQVAEMLLAAAFIANEAAQGLELELFPEADGRQGLTMHPGGDVPDWPAHSLEFQVWMLMAQGQSCVSDIVYDLFKEDLPQPAQQIVRFVASALNRPELERLSGEFPLEPVSRLLHQTSEGRPDVWAELFAEIRIGLENRRS